MGEAQSAIEVFPTPSPPGLRPHEKIIEAAYVKDKMGERMKQDDIKSGSLEHAEHLLGMLRGYRQAQVLMTCTESGVFEALAGHGRSAAVLAAALALDPDALRRLLDAAVALGLLERAEDIYSNAPATAVCLASDGDNYLGHLFRRESAFYERWGRLPEAIRTGHRPEPNRAMEDTGDWVRNFEYALYDLARLYGPAVAEALDLASDRP
ncbi:MAG TPA: hypothetical protein DEP84_27010, partial [Chloroflexi bacterium]|nr:hypothetical protein [Chloroflexota bacterium]